MCRLIYFVGLEYATKALALDLTNANAHKWYAILTGMEVEFLPLKDRIKNVCIFHKHILNALEYDSRDFSLYHVLGRFKFEVIKKKKCFHNGFKFEVTFRVLI